MEYAVSPPPVYALEIAGRAERFPVNRVFCVGRNYAAHAREMGKDPEREAPFFFMKPAGAVVPAGAEEVSVPYPPMTSSFHHEIELVVAIGKGGTDIPVERALDHVYGYAVGIT
jgi:fumarylpyruvate hydrolase